MASRSLAAGGGYLLLAAEAARHPNDDDESTRHAGWPATATPFSKSPVASSTGPCENHAARHGVVKLLEVTPRQIRNLAEFWAISTQVHEDSLLDIIHQWRKRWRRRTSCNAGQLGMGWPDER